MKALIIERSAGIFLGKDSNGRVLAKFLNQEFAEKVAELVNREAAKEEEESIELGSEEEAEQFLAAATAETLLEDE